MQSFFERHHDVRFDIGPALGCSLPSAESPEGRSAAAAAEKRFKEIAEPRSAEFKFNSAVPAAPLIKSPAGLLRSPLRRRLKSARLVPIGAQLVVFLSLFRIA